jgi:hypothetical protein
VTQDALLDNLRDIHLPPVPPGSAVQIFAPEPFLVLAVIALCVFGTWYRRKKRWLRAARTQLFRFEAALVNVQEPASFSEDQWTCLVDLATDVARRTQAARLPDYVFWSPERAGRAEHQALLDYLRRTLTVRT